MTQSCSDVFCDCYSPSVSNVGTTKTCRRRDFSVINRSVSRLKKGLQDSIYTVPVRSFAENYRQVTLYAIKDICFRL